MEKGELKTGQLLGITEKNGKLIREYVAGFFGEEPIIKQRLLTPQETRRYREDLERGKKQGKSESEAARDAGRIRAGASLAEKPGQRGKQLRPDVHVRKSPVGSGDNRLGSVPDQFEQTAERPRSSRMAARSVDDQQESTYFMQSGAINKTFIQNLIDSETDKPNFNPANQQKALNTINRIGCPEMKIFRLGKKSGDVEGDSYTQKEHLARVILGLPMWKPKVESPKTHADDPAESEKQETELVTVDATVVNDTEASAEVEYNNEE